MLFLQRQAVYSGLHFFKCPLCNDKDRFQADMLVYGIYIPDQYVICHFQMILVIVNYVIRN